MDFLAFLLGNREPVISDQLAFSWGYFQENLQWQSVSSDVNPSVENRSGGLCQVSSSYTQSKVFRTC